MDKRQVIEKIKTVRVIPVIRTASAEQAESVVEALIEGGLTVLEVTLTIPGAFELIERLTSRYGNTALIGAGTVLDAEAAQKCLAAGAKFIVSPILDLETVAFCRREEIAVMPGALTPTEIFRAHQVGADLVKIFPVSAMGGAAYLKAVKAVFPQMELIPTGGINAETAVEYLRAGACAVGIGGELTQSDQAEIIRHARRLRDVIKLNFPRQ